MDTLTFDQSGMLVATELWKDLNKKADRLCPSCVDASKEEAKRGGLQEHSIGDHYPWVVVGVENPELHKPEEWATGIGSQLVVPVKGNLVRGTFYYVMNPDGTYATDLYRNADQAYTMALLIKQGKAPAMFLTLHQFIHD